MTLHWNIANILCDDMTPDDDGVVWAATVSGWDTPDTSEVWRQKPNDHGALMGPQLYSYRDLEIQMWGISNSADVIKRARMNLLEKVELGNEIVVQSIEQIPWTASGVRSGKMYIQHPVANQIRVNMLVRCKDPRKYGPTQTFEMHQGTRSPGVKFPHGMPLRLGNPNSGVLLVNEGSSRAPVNFTFHGPLPGVFWIRNVRQNRRIAYNFDLSSGDVLIINGRTGAVLLNGSVSYRTLQTPDSQMFSLDPGETQLQFGASSLTSGYVSGTFAQTSMG